MAESKAGTGYEGRQLHADGKDLRVPEVVPGATERRDWWTQLGRERSVRAWACGENEAQPGDVQAAADGVKPRVCVVGKSHLAFCTAVAAARRGFEVYPEEEIAKAELVLLAEDVSTDASGIRGLEGVIAAIRKVERVSAFPVIASQVPPGFTRALGFKCFHQPEQLRIVTATDNACNPPRIVVGCAQPTTFQELPAAYRTYLSAFNCPVLLMSYEEAEFSKIAINIWLAAQVDCTNRLSAAAAKVGASWERITEAMRLDPRIGKEAYLTPGRWQDSLHLLRDDVTLREIEGEGI